MNIFVYGSLMKGGGNHFLLDNEYSEYVGKSVTKREFTLYDLGGFPGMVSGGNNAVLGEIYKICLFVRSRLDQLEGHPQFYRRTIIELQSGEKVETYLLNPSFAEGCDIIGSGDWRSKK